MCSWLSSSLEPSYGQVAAEWSQMACNREQYWWWSGTHHLQLGHSRRRLQVWEAEVGDGWPVECVRMRVWVLCVGWDINKLQGAPIDPLQLTWSFSYFENTKFNNCTKYMVYTSFSLWKIDVITMDLCSVPEPVAIFFVSTAGLSDQSYFWYSWSVRSILFLVQLF